jgi:hypothetical protein
LHGHADVAVFGPRVAHVRAIPLLSRALTLMSWPPRTQRPAASAPVAAANGSVGSSTVTAAECVWKVAPGPQLPAPQMTIC